MHSAAAKIKEFEEKKLKFLEFKRALGRATSEGMVKGEMAELFLRGKRIAKMKEIYARDNEYLMRHVQRCLEKGLGPRSSTRDVRKVLGDRYAQSTILRVAGMLGIKGARTILRKEVRLIGKTRAVQGILRRIYAGERVNLNTIPIDKTQRLTIGEDLLIRQGVNEKALHKLRDLGFLEEEIEILKREISKKEPMNK